MPLYVVDPAGVATVYVRYKQVQALALGGELKLHRLNCAGMVLGIMSSVGMCVVANFQVHTALPTPLFHYNYPLI